MLAALARRPVVESLVVTTLVTCAAVAVAKVAPAAWVATSVGIVFLVATWALVWRRDDAVVLAHGLSLGGLVIPGRVDGRGLASSLVAAVGWASVVALVTLPLYVVGFRLWHGVTATPPLPMRWSSLASDAAGQLVIIALPEEAFYRGYLQTRLDEAFPRRVPLLGAPLGLSVVVTSVLFALGHVATIPSPARLAVFFPSLLFGWLRARTGGIGAAVFFHAACNLLEATLVHTYAMGIRG